MAAGQHEDAGEHDQTMFHQMEDELMLGQDDDQIMENSSVTGNFDEQEATATLISMDHIPPPLPDVDYRHKVASPSGVPELSWSPLQTELEVDSEREYVWTINNWSEVSKQDEICSPIFDVSGFKW